MTPADTSFQVIIMWVSGLATLLSFGTALWMIFSGPAKRNASKLDDHSSRLGVVEKATEPVPDLQRTVDSVKQRVTVLEQAQRALPSREDVHAISLSLAEMRGDIKAMRAEMEGNTAIVERLEAVVGRHENHLLKG